MNKKISTDNQKSIEKIIKSHNHNIKSATSKSNQLYQHYVRQVKIAYWSTIVFFVLFTLISVSVLSAGLYTAFIRSMDTFEHFISVAAIVCGIIFILFLLFNNPIKLTRKSLNDLIKINIIYTGYTRQIYQIDAEFNTLLVMEDSSAAEIESLAKRMQETVEQTIDTLLISSDEFIE